jgi:hypothetical protein
MHQVHQANVVSIEVSGEYIVPVAIVITGSLSKNLGCMLGWNSIHNREHSPV